MTADAFRWFALAGGALIAWGLWLGEVCWLKGWAGLTWVSGFNWSSVPICFLIAFVTARFVGPRRSSSQRIAFIIAASLISIASFVIARWAALDLFGGPVASGTGRIAILGILISAVLSSLGLAWSANRWLRPMKMWAVLLVALVLLIVLPLSIATIRIFPALNGSVDEIHAIKMGYPVLWVALLMPLALRAAVKPTP